MKRNAIVIVVALVLAAIVWVLISKTKSSEQQEPRTPKPHAATTQKPSVVSPASNAVSNTANAAKPGAVPIPSYQAHPSVGATVVEAITGGGELETNVFKEPFIKRCRPIAISPQTIEKAGKLVPGSRLGLELFSDAKYFVTLQSVNRSPQGDLSIGGRLDGEEYGTFVLSTAGGVVLARLADPQARKLFLIRCGGKNHTQYAVEVDVEKTPVPGNISNVNKQ